MLSSSRAPNQLLHLLLNCAWHTPSADVVLQYLSLSAGKFQRLRRLIARPFRDLPGYDRENWEQIIESFVANELVSQPGLDEKELRRSIDEWLPICTCENDEAMPKALAITLSDRVAKYWQAKLAVSDLEAAREVFSGAYSAADAVSTALRQWPEEVISKIQLNRLLTMVISIGNSRFRPDREVSSFDVVSSAEVAPLRSNSINHTIWIDPSVSGNDYFPPLSSEELDGIPLAPDSTQQTIFSQSALQRSYDPILLATHSLTLITIDTTPELLRLQLTAYDWRKCISAFRKRHPERSDEICRYRANNRFLLPQKNTMVGHRVTSSSAKRNRILQQHGIHGSKATRIRLKIFCSDQGRCG